MAGKLPSGRIVRTICKDNIALGISTIGRLPVLVVTVKTGSCDERKAFRKFLKANGLSSKEVHRSADETPNGFPVWAAYDVTGNPYGLLAIADAINPPSFVREVSYALDVKPPRGSVGSGTQADADRAKRQSMLQREQIASTTEGTLPKKQGKGDKVTVRSLVSGKVNLDADGQLQWAEFPVVKMVQETIPSRKTVSPFVPVPVITPSHKVPVIIGTWEETELPS